MLTAATYKQLPLFNSRAKLDSLQQQLFEIAGNYGLALQAWSIFPNHYHAIMQTPREVKLGAFVRTFHGRTGQRLNELDGTPRRQVWFQFWDSHLTYAKSYRARMNYVHRNPVHHGLVREASRYPWCSAAWFERVAQRAFVETIYSLPCDHLKVPDDFAVSRADFSPRAQRSKNPAP